MAEYIEREALISEIQEEVDFKTPMYTEEQNKYFNMGLKCALRDVKRQPTADVVEVVRCEDCKYFRANASASDRFSCGRCVRNSSFEPLEISTMMGFDFCSYGKRRSDNG